MTDRRPDSHGSPALTVFSGRDAFLLIYLPAMALLAWCVPERAWDRLCRRIVWLTRPFRRRRRRQNAAQVGHLLGGRCVTVRPQALVEALAAHRHETRLQLLRSRRLGRWQPHLDLIGREHLDRALSAGQGGILWILPGVFADLTTKMTLHSAGFAVAHLSRPTHGFSPSRFGMRVLNPLWTTVECRYLAERLVVLPGQSGALKELVRRVRANQLVSIAVHSSGQRIYELPFFDGTVRVADGAAVLAETTGAMLFPVHTARTGPGWFVTTIEPPLQAPEGSDRRQRVRSLLTQCAAAMESYALHWPDQFSGWYLA